MRGVTKPPEAIVDDIEFQLTRLMRGVTIPMNDGPDTERISTHTPHARRDRSFP